MHKVPKQSSTKRRAGKESGGSAESFTEGPVHLSLFVEQIGVVGITEEGDYLGMELQFTSGERATVMFPQAMFQKLMAALMSAGAAAYAERVNRLGTEGNLLAWSGAEPFAPTDFEFGRGRTADGVDVLTTRLKKDHLPVVDFGLSFPRAEEFARGLLQELAKGAAPPKVVQ